MTELHSTNGFTIHARRDVRAIVEYRPPVSIDAEDYQAGIQAGVDAIRKYGIKVWIANTAESTWVMPQDKQQWRATDAISVRAKAR